MSPRQSSDHIQPLHGSLVVDIFNLDPIIQKVQTDLQHEENFQLVSHRKHKGVRAMFPSDRQLRSKSKVSSNSFSALSDD